MTETTSLHPRAGFTRMTESTPADWAIIAGEAVAMQGRLADRLLAEMRALGGDTGGFAVDRLEHCLQTATLAAQDGRDEEYVVCALLHDIGDMLGPANHADVAAVLLEPYVSEENHWIVKHHGIFQGYFFFHHVGLDRDMRERFRGHDSFEATALFCERYDQAAFDPAFVTRPLESFEPAIRRLFAAPRRSLYRKAA